MRTVKWLPILLLASPAWADPCPSREKLVRQLADAWGEASVFQGLAADGLSIIEIFVRPDKGWTVVVVMPDGTACPVASGHQWIGFGIPQGEPG